MTRAPKLLSLKRNPHGVFSELLVLDTNGRRVMLPYHYDHTKPHKENRRMALAFARMYFMSRVVQQSFPPTPS